MPSNPLFAPTAAALAAILIFSTGGLAIKSIDLPALMIAGFRTAIAALFFVPYILLRFKKNPERFHLNPYGKIAAASFVVMTIAYVCAMKLTTAANVICLQYTMPAWVMVGGAIWLGEAVTFNRCGVILFCFLGMLLFFQGELNAQDWLGSAVALLSGISLSVLIISLRLNRAQESIIAVFWGNAVSAILLVPFSLIYWPDAWRQLGMLTNWAGLLWLGLFQIGVAYILYTYALKRMPAIEIAILSLIEPVLNPTWVYIGLKEIPDDWTLWGGGLILLSVLLRALLREDVSETENS